ncbi:MAG: hypothetical protein P9X27_03145 [Candidatus Kaelpia aquatica]|nr:hypothetical protein [Candidatus Kaelpia aquatica]
MKHSLETGISFGLTSGVITTLGVMVGLHSTTHSRIAVAGGVITIAVADAFSDALGIHMSEESEAKHSPLEVWLATISTFFAKVLFASIFIIPIVLLPIQRAVYVSIGLGFLILILFSYYLALKQKLSPLRVIAEHLSVAALVLISSHYLGLLASGLFK